MSFIELAVLLFAISAAMGVALYRRNLLQQAETLRASADAIADGNIGSRACLEPGPLLLVGKSFDNMACHVEERIASLEESRTVLEQMMLTDRLTGVGNRRAFDQFIEREVAVVNRYGVPASVMMIDIDHFKRINDDFGHSIGDQVLVDLTRRILSRLRDTDYLFRWGGEEFAVVTPCTPISGAEVLSEALRAVVAERPFSTVGTVTISIGLAQLRSSETAAQWVARADKYLYDAKRRGRNRCRSCVEAPDQSAPFILVWGEQFLTHHERIDAEHAEIFRLANDLVLLHPTCDLAETLLQFDNLLAHLKDHFAAEEAMLESLGHTEVTQHAKQHRGLLAQAGELRRRLVAGEVDPFDVGDFIIRRVAVGHLVNCDLPLFASLSESAVMPAAGASPEPATLRMKLQRVLAR